MSTESLVKSGFVLTSRAFEQPVINKAFEAKTAEQSAVPGYVSTAAQTNQIGKDQNSAIRYSALASFTLGKSSAVNDFNAKMRKVQLEEKLNAN